MVSLPGELMGTVHGVPRRINGSIYHYMKMSKINCANSPMVDGLSCHWSLSCPLKSRCPPVSFGGASVAKRTFRWSDNASGIRHRSTGNHSPKAIWCPVDRPVRNRLPVVLLLVLIIERQLPILCTSLTQSTRNQSTEQAGFPLG